MKPLYVISTPQSAYFANAIAQRLANLGLDPRYQRNAPSIRRLSLQRNVFQGGEIYRRIGTKTYDELDALKGANIVIVGSTHSETAIADIYNMGCAFSQFGTYHRYYAIPFFGYSTMERGVLPGEIVTAKTIARKLSSIPNSGIGNMFAMLDLHASGIRHYFEGDCARDELYAEQMIRGALDNVAQKHLSKQLLLGSADLGRPYWVRAYADYLGVEIAMVDKTRVMEETEVFTTLGESVKGKIVVIYDDMIRSGETIFDAVEAYLAQGAVAVYVIATHGAFCSPSVVSKLGESQIEHVYVTNSHPNTNRKAVRDHQKITVMDVSSVFAKDIASYWDNPTADLPGKVVQPIAS